MMQGYKGTRSIKSIMQNVDPEIVTWRRKLANNTVEYATKDGSRYIRLHDTDIISYLPNGDIILDSGGWQTPTTKDRMNRFLTEGKICQERNVWYLWMGNETVGTEKYAYKDGMVIYRDYIDEHQYTIRVKGAEKVERLNSLQKQIKNYVNGYCEKLFTGQLNPPSPGDCWFCSMHEVNSNRSLGESSRNNEHILSHFEEKYYAPSIVCNAIDDCGASQAAKHYLAYCFGMTEQRVEWWEGVASKQIRSALTRYLRKQLGLAR